MKTLNALILPCLISLLGSFPAFSANSPVFQVRLAVPANSAAVAPVGSEKLPLTHVNPASGRTSREFLYVQPNVLLDQRDIQSAKVVTDERSHRPRIAITFTDAGRKHFAEVTRTNIDRRLAIIISGQVWSAPVIRTEIPGGKAEISGDFTRQEAEDLSRKINETIKN